MTTLPSLTTHVSRFYILQRYDMGKKEQPAIPFDVTMGRSRGMSELHLTRELANCRVKNECPLVGKCRTKILVYNYRHSQIQELRWCQSWPI